MKYFRICATTPYAGTDTEEYLAVKDNGFAEAIAEDYAREVCRDNAENFEYLIAGWDEEPTEEELEQYHADCDSWFEEISKEEYEENN